MLLILCILLIPALISVGTYKVVEHRHRHKPDYDKIARLERELGIGGMPQIIPSPKQSLYGLPRSPDWDPNDKGRCPNCGYILSLTGPCTTCGYIRSKAKIVQLYRY